MFWMLYQDLQRICVCLPWIESFHQIHNFQGFQLLLTTNITKLSVCTLQKDLQQSTSLLHLEMMWLFFSLWEKSNLINFMSS